MQNLFYVPPHQPQETHHKPTGVRTTVKRNQPERLDLSAQLHPSVVDAGLITEGDIAAEAALTPNVVFVERVGWVSRIRAAIGKSLVHMGRKIAGNETLLLGQPT